MTWEVCRTSHGRPAYVVMSRSTSVAMTGGCSSDEARVSRTRLDTLGGVGGKPHIGGEGSRSDVLELTARREVAEEVGVDLTGVELAYVSNSYFVTDNGDPVVNVVLAGAMPAGAEPRVAAPDEVAGIVWLALAEAESDPYCPPWTVRSLRRAACS